MKTELFVIPLATLNKSLHVLVTKESEETENAVYSVPSIALRPDLLQQGSLHQLLRELLSTMPADELENWLNSPRCKDRIVDAYDRELLFEQVQGVAIVRSVAVSEDFSQYAKGTWIKAESLFTENSEQNFTLSLDSRLFLRECLNLFPAWIKNTSFVFELLPQVFSIQELRELASVLAHQTIDAGNFHRRLKKLNILRPLRKSQERVHKWEFDWGKSNILLTEGLLL